MYRARWLCMGIFLAWLLVPLTAWSQAGPSEKDLADAIQKLKDVADAKLSVHTSFRFQLQQAQRMLADNYPQSFPLVVALLDEGDAQIRLNATVVLAGSAQRVKPPTPELIEGLKRCVQDSNSSVAYWGVQGLTVDTMPTADKLDAIGAGLDMNRPRQLRLATARVVEDNRIREAIPNIVEHLQRILPPYTAQVEAMLTYEETVGESGEATRTGRSATRFSTRSSTYSGRDIPSGRRDVPRAPVMPGRTGRTGRAPVPMPGRRTVSPTRSTLRRGEEDLEAQVIQRRIDPEKLSIQEVEELMFQLREMPAVIELHQIGLILEQLARKSPLDMPFGEGASFETTPLWDLARCVEAAVVWLDKNRAEFPQGPAPAQPEVQETPAPEGGEAPKPEEPAAPESEEAEAPEA